MWGSHRRQQAENDLLFHGIRSYLTCIHGKEWDGDCQMGNVGPDCELAEDIARKSGLAIIIAAGTCRFLGCLQSFECLA